MEKTKFILLFFILSFLFIGCSKQEELPSRKEPPIINTRNLKESVTTLLNETEYMWQSHEIEPMTSFLKENGKENEFKPVDAVEITDKNGFIFYIYSFDENTDTKQVKSFMRSRTIPKHYYYAVSNDWLFVSLKEHRELRKSILQIFSFSHLQSNLYMDSDTFEDGTYSLYSNSYIKDFYTCSSKMKLLDEDKDAKFITDDNEFQSLKPTLIEYFQPVISDPKQYTPSLEDYLKYKNITSLDKVFIIQIKASEDIVSAYIMNNSALIVHYVQNKTTDENQYIYMLGIVDQTSTFKTMEFHFAGFTSGLINFYDL